MADFGLFIGFGFPTRGREEAAVKVFGELLALLGGQMAQGNVESFEPVFLQPHGGDLGGFVLVRGQQEKLNALVGSAEFQRSITRADVIVENFGVINCQMGAELQKQMGSFLADTADLR